MDVYIVMTDSYPIRPTVAFLDKADAVRAAARIHGLTEEWAASRVKAVPVLFADPPSFETLVNIDSKQSLAVAKARSDEDSTTELGNDQDGASDRPRTEE